MHFAGLAIDLDIGHPRCPCRAEARPFAVHVARIREALTKEDVAALAQAAIGVFLRAGAHAPAGFLRGRLHQLDGAWIVQMAEAKLHRVDTGGCRQLVDVRLVRERTRKRRHAAQPRRAHDRRHVVDLDAQVVVGIRRARRAIAHFVRLRNRLDGPREQQGERRGTVGRVRSLEVIGRNRTIGKQPAVDLHQLRCALRLPRVFLLACELHPHRRADRTRQQRGIAGHVVGAVAAVTAGRFHANHVDLHIAHAHQFRKVGAQYMRTLRASPDAQHDGRFGLCFCFCLCFCLCPGLHRHVRVPFRQRAGGTDRCVHLEGPHIRPLHRATRCSERGQCAIDIALVDQQALRRGVVANRLCHVAEVGHAGPRLPCHAQRTQRLFRMLFALRDDANEVADHHHGADAGDVRDRRFIDRLQRVADEVAMVSASVRRTHHATVQHAGYPHVVHEDEFARQLGRNIDTRLRGADDAVVVGMLQLRVMRQLQHGALPRDELAKRDAALALVCDANPAIANDQRRHGHAELYRRTRHQPGPRLGRREAQRLRVVLDRCAGDGAALVGRARGVAQHHAHARHAEIEFFGNDLCKGGLQPGAEVDVAVQAGCTAVVPDSEQHLVAFDRVARNERGLTLRGRRRGRRRTHDDEHAVGLQEVGAGARLVGPARRHCAALMVRPRPCAARRAGLRERSRRACRNGTGCLTVRRGCVLHSGSARAPTVRPPASPCR